jgi:hypothetical protein
MRGVTIALALVASLVLAACGDDGGGGGASTEGNEALLTSAGFEKALESVKEESGDDAPILQIQITQGGADFKIRDGEQATGFIYTGGELHDEEVDVIGPGTLEGQDFPLTEVDAAAIDRIVSGVNEQAGIPDINVTVMTLEKNAVDGELKWVVNAEGGGRAGLVYNANPDGSNVTSPTGSIAGTGTGGGDTGEESGGGEAPAGSASEIAECVQNAGGDVAKIQACTQ